MLPCGRPARRRKFQGSLSPASRRGQTRGCPKVSRVVITLPRPRRVEDNAPYRLHRLSLGIDVACAISPAGAQDPFQREKFLEAIRAELK